VPSSLLPGFRGPHSVATSDPAGATATELMSFGRPVVSMYSAHFATCLANMRDAELVAGDEDQYLALLRRLIADPGPMAAGDRRG